MSKERFDFKFSCMGCPCRISIYANCQNDAKKAFRITQNEVERLDQKYSHYRQDSQLQALQQSACAEEGVEVDAETSALLNYAATQFNLSKGLFDITARALTKLWDRIENLPSSEQLQAALNLTGWQKLQWDGHKLIMPAGMSFDLGGIVKEYAADRVIVLLREAGFDSGYVDLGGDLHFLGPHPDGKGWLSGIRNPKDKSNAICSLEIRGGALASSGNYERFSLIGSKRYGHILDPRSGWPVEGLISVSVLASSCLVAGSMATLAMLHSQSDGLALLDESGLPWLAVDQEHRVSSSRKFRSNTDFMAQPELHTVPHYPG
jgi:thiamine biosynthesis lipoprotein